MTRYTVFGVPPGDKYITNKVCDVYSRQSAENAIISAVSHGWSGLYVKTSILYTDSSDAELEENEKDNDYSSLASYASQKDY